MDFNLTDNEFKIFRDFIYEKSGIYFSDINKAVLENRLYEIVLKNKYNSVMDYYNEMQNNEGKVKTFLDKVTTNLTKFFRNQTQFEALQAHVINDLTVKNQSNPDRTIKIWSAGCSTGEEPYTIAIIAQEALGLNSGWQLEIIASDISLKSLMKAKEGFYDEQRIKNVPDYFKQKYFEKVGNGFMVKKEIKNLINFDYHNLKHDFNHKNFDIIFCRNVIIYFDQKAQLEVINKFYNKLKPYGYLFLGHSESLFGMETKFKFNKVGDAISYLKEEE